MDGAYIGEGEMPRLQVPVTCILSEQFTYWPDNFDSVKELLASSNARSQSQCVTLVGTSHLHQSDILLVLRNLLRFDIRSPFQMAPIRAMALNTEVSARFIQDVFKQASFTKQPSFTNSHNAMYLQVHPVSSMDVI
ncbi:hypothetical protein DM01DRAFT_1378749 [Hesseltinella vesiculosa]|uniref:1-alkyl-2-acetylglycerophosphocholine esterase n=1 Tax=Hesseltinella vesiculosa TaxID=101127 RepID=A0A1X2G3A9_9FUNG|nr:hypothetical protein DM01DRAFT_1378749 [Hesseltinella vesiculosa]